jgi:predicted porin
MNKKLLAASIAVAMTAPMVASADITMYGRLNTALIMTDSDDGYYDGWDVENNASRFGVKGTEDLGNGMKAVFQYEWSVDSSDEGTLGGRLAYVGLTGGFGTVAIGRQWTPYYGSVDKTDIMQMPSANDHYMGTTRVGDALAYVSPSMGGFSAKLALVIGEENNDPMWDETDGVDVWNLSLDYNNGPLSVGLSYLSDEHDDQDLWGIGGKYNFGDFALFAQYEQAGDVIVDEYYGEDGWVVVRDDFDAWGIGAEVYLGNNTIRAVYGQMDSHDNWALGFEHNFSKMTRVYAEYQDTEIGGHSNAADEVGKRFGIGIRHDF